MSLADGGRFDEKPEHMTQLSGNRLVAKDHARIRFRGLLDSYQSAILVLQEKVFSSGNSGLCDDLGDLLEISRQVMRGDVMDERLGEALALGLTDAELRERSHHPKKYFGVGHVMADFTMGETVLALNRLRSRVREVEVAAVTAFRRDFEITRTDIIQALNRSSSAFYIMMIKENAGLYRKQ